MGAALLGLREMRRRKGRFTLLTGAVAVLLFLIVFQQALLGALVGQFIGAIRNQSATVLVYGEDARLNLQGSVVSAASVSAIAAVDGVAEAAPLGVSTLTVDAGGEQQDATLFGHALDGPAEPTRIAEGRRPTRDGEAVASASAGEGFAVGDTVIVQPGGYEIDIVGTANNVSFSVTPTLFASYATYEEVQLSVNPDARAASPSAVAVTVEPDAEAAAVAEEINVAVDGVQAVTRTQAADEAPGVESVSQSFGVVLLLTYVVATIVIGFFFVILTVQKTPTLTLLRAVGASSRSLVVALGVQVAIVVVGGILLGSALAAAALSASDTGIEARVEPDALARTMVVVVVLSALACIGAARRITRLDPAAAVLPGATR